MDPLRDFRVPDPQKESDVPQGPIPGCTTYPEVPESIPLQPEREPPRAPPTFSSASSRPTGFTSFIDAAKIRLNRKAETQGPPQSQSAKPSMSMPFNPATQIHQQQWTTHTNQLPKRKQKHGSLPHSKRPKTGSAMPAPPSSASDTSKPSKSKQPALVKWNVTLFPITSAFKSPATLIVQPRKHDLDSFAFSGYCRIVELSREPSSSEIHEKITTTFSDFGVDMDEWRLLFRQGMGRGSDGVLRLQNRANSKFLTLQNLQQACAEYRVPQYTRTIFILLPAGSVDLPVDMDSPTPYIPREYGKTNDEESSTSEGENSAASNDDDIDDVKLKTEDESQDTHSAPSDEAQNVDPFPEQDKNTESFRTSCNAAEHNITSKVTNLYRLSYNICGPDKDDKKNYVIWWPYRTSGAYSNIHAQLIIFNSRIDTLNILSVADSHLLVTLVEDTVGTLQPLFQFLVDLLHLKADDFDAFQRHFGEEFRLGPHGLQPATHYFFRLYTSLITAFEKGFMSMSALSQCLNKLDIIATPLLSLLMEFRRTVPRALFDPKGISDFQDVLKKRSHYFGVADETDRLSVLKLRLAYDTVPTFREALFKDFGSLTDHTQVRNNTLLVGMDGLDGLLCIIEQVVDSFPIDDPRYAEFINLFSQIGATLAKKMLNFSKSAAKKKVNTNNDVPKSDDQKERKGYNTRSHDGKQKDTVNMSESDSSAPSFFEYEPSPGGKSKFDQKRRERARFSDVLDSDESDDPPTVEEVLQEMSPPRPRPRTEYPRTRASREYTSKEPPPPKAKPQPQSGPRPRPRPRPRPIPPFTPATQPAAKTPYERLMDMSLDNLMREIVQACPDPGFEWNVFVKQYSTVRERHRQLLLRCHPDKIVGKSPKWVALCEDYIKVLNEKKKNIV